MIPFRVQLLSCALVLAGFSVANAGEVQATEVCNRRSASYSRSCYDPCEPVGPVRRFFRRAFLRPCPPPCPCPPVVYAPQPGFAPAPRPVFVPNAPPPANLGRPIAPPSQPVPNEAAFPAVPSNRYPRLTPPVSPPLPIRLDRMASRNGE